jgi:hypothetical protein
MFFLLLDSTTAASMPEIEGFTCWRSDGVQGGRRKPEPILPEVGNIYY